MTNILRCCVFSDDPAANMGDLHPVGPADNGWEAGRTAVFASPEQLQCCARRTAPGRCARSRPRAHANARAGAGERARAHPRAPDGVHIHAVCGRRRARRRQRPHGVVQVPHGGHGAVRGASRGVAAGRDAPAPDRPRPAGVVTPQWRHHDANNTERQGSTDALLHPNVCAVAASQPLATLAHIGHR